MGIEWSPELSIDNGVIDEEHKKLLELANSFVQSINETRPKAEISRHLQALREYTVTHFNNEEAFMSSIAYPERGKHVNAHNQLKKKVKEFQSSLFHGEKPEYDLLREMLRQWLIGHILTYDRSLRDFLNAEPKTAEPEGPQEA